MQYLQFASINAIQKSLDPEHIKQLHNAIVVLSGNAKPDLVVDRAIELFKTQTYELDTMLNYGKIDHAQHSLTADYAYGIRSLHNYNLVCNDLSSKPIIDNSEVSLANVNQSDYTQEAYKRFVGKYLKLGYTSFADMRSFKLIVAWKPGWLLTYSHKDNGKIILESFDLKNDDILIVSDIDIQLDKVIYVNHFGYDDNWINPYEAKTANMLTIVNTDYNYWRNEILIANDAWRVKL
jgi:hypothetical protein